MMDNKQRNFQDADSTGVRHAILRKEFGHAWELWVWVRHQFTPSSLTVIFGILGLAATYIIHLNDRVGRQQAHITVLETQVVPLLKQNDRVVEMLSSVGIVVQRLTAIDERLGRLETNRDPRINQLEERVMILEVQHEREVIEARRPISQLRRLHR